MIWASDLILYPPAGTWRRAVVGVALLAFICLSGGLLAQELPGGTTVSPATVTFTLDFPQSNPEHYSIEVNAGGHARYESKGKIAAESDDESYDFEFEISPETRQKVFEWAKQANYFAGKIDSGNRKLAFTGAKILSYSDRSRSSTARYNYSTRAPVRQLTDLFQNMAATLEFGRRLAYFHRYQKLALDEEMERMESQARDGTLGEIQSVAPILREIAEDPSVINGVRARASALIQRGSGPPAGH